MLLLHNVPCSASDTQQCSAARRTFRLSVDPLLISYSNVLLAAFFDLDEDVSLIAEGYVQYDEFMVGANLSRFFH